MLIIIIMKNHADHVSYQGKTEFNVKYFATDVGGLLKQPGACITVLAKTKWEQ